MTTVSRRPRDRSCMAICRVPTTNGMSNGMKGATAIDITVPSGRADVPRHASRASRMGGHS